MATKNSALRAEPASTMLWILQKGATDVACVFAAVDGRFELRIVRHGIRCAIHHFGREADAVQYAADLEADLKSHGWIENS